MPDFKDLTEDLETTNEQINFDHKLIINLCNNLHKSLERGISKTVCLSIIDTLIRFTNKHFQYEESLMDMYNYKFTEIHKDQHKLLLIDLDTIKTNILKEDNISSLNLILYYEEYIKKHVVTMDKLLED